MYACIHCIMLLCNIALLYTSTMIVSNINSLNKIAQQLQNNTLLLSEFILVQNAIFINTQLLQNFLAW